MGLSEQENTERNESKPGPKNAREQRSDGLKRTGSRVESLRSREKGSKKKIGKKLSECDDSHRQEDTKTGEILLSLRPNEGKAGKGKRTVRTNKLHRRPSGIRKESQSEATDRFIRAAEREHGNNETVWPSTGPRGSRFRSSRGVVQGNPKEAIKRNDSIFGMRQWVFTLKAGKREILEKDGPARVIIASKKSKNKDSFNPNKLGALSKR